MGVSLHGNQKRPLCEAVKMKPRLLWTSLEIRDARAMGYLPRKADSREWNQPKRKKCVAVNKVERNWTPEVCFDITHQNAEFGDFSAGFLFGFGPVFPYYAPFGMVRFIL